MRALLVVFFLFSGVLVAGWLWLANRPVEAVSPQEIASHRMRAIEWLHRHEQQVLAEPNTALWWMMRLAARHADDAYLRQLVRQSIEIHFRGVDAMSPWRRMIEPRAEIVAFAGGVDEVADYQRFFHHAMTCQSLPLGKETTTQFLQRDMCTPMWWKGFVRDPVCTTHQIFGQMLYRQTGCPEVEGLSDLQPQLLDNVERQLTWDPVMRDAHIQRVLVLVMNGRQDAVKANWLRRILAAQESDGGWLGYSRIPELPNWIQPWCWRETLAQWFPARFPREHQDFDFHATAQAILLLTLLQPPAAVHAQ
jgi:hypothetical protein